MDHSSSMTSVAGDLSEPANLLGVHRLIFASHFEKWAPQRQLSSGVPRVPKRTCDRMFRTWFRKVDC